MNELDKKENYTNQTFEDIKHIMRMVLNIGMQEITISFEL